MKLTSALIDKLIRLRDGEEISASSIKGDWIEELIEERIICSRSHGTRKSFGVLDKNAFIASLERYHEGLGNLEKMRDILSNNGILDEAVRAEQAASTGNSKIKMTRSFPGFLVNSYEPIECTLKGLQFTVSPNEGSSIFISDWQSFIIPQDVIIVGIENPENFRHIRRQRNLFETTIGIKRLLFVSRYPQSTDLRNWLISIPNSYIHFGDFDLAGIKIYQTEFHKYLIGRSSFLIPPDIESRLKCGSTERFNGNYYENRAIHSEQQEVQQLIEMILKYHKCYDQEGYIGNPSVNPVL